MAFIFDPANAPTPACHAPTIAALPDRLVAAWFGGTREKHPDVGIWASTCRDGHWSEPREVADGGGEACWNPVLVDTAAGLLLFYKIGRSPGSWRGAVLRSADRGESWQPGPKLPAGFLGPIKNKPLLLADGGLLCPSSRESSGWRCHFEYLPGQWALGDSEVRASTQAVPDPAGLQAIQPAVLNRGGAFEAWVRTRRGVVGRTRSADGASWSALAATPLPNPNAGIDAVALADGRAVLVCNPVATVAGRWGGPRTPLAIAVDDGDGSWRVAHVLEDRAGEFSYPAIVRDGGVLHIVYTYRRRTIKHVRLPAGTTDRW